jgi:hypothetical protein
MCSSNIVSPHQYNQHKNRCTPSEYGSHHVLKQSLEKGM